MAIASRAYSIEGCTQGSEEEREFAMIAEAVEAYGAVRWPDGKIPSDSLAQVYEERQRRVDRAGY